MPITRLQVFVSSTRDAAMLERHREVVEIVESLGHEAITMTKFTAAPSPSTPITPPIP